MIAELRIFFYAYVTNELNDTELTCTCCQKEPLPDVSTSTAAVNSWQVTHFKVSNPQSLQGYTASLNIETR